MANPVLQFQILSVDEVTGYANKAVSLGAKILIPQRVFPMERKWRFCSFVPQGMSFGGYQRRGQ